MNEILYPPGKEESYAKLFSPPIFFWDPIALNHRQVLNYPLSLYFCSIELQFDRQRGIFKPVFRIRIQMMRIRIRIHGSAFRNCGSGSGSRLIYEQISYTRCKSKTFNFFYFFIPKKISGRRLLIGLEDQDRLQDVLLQPTAPLFNRFVSLISYFSLPVDPDLDPH